jgi:hypothetical protein
VVKPVGTSPSLTTDRVDKMYRQLAEIDAIAAPQLEECARWHRSDSAPSPSSHVAMVTSLLSNSFSRARSCPYSSTTTIFEGDGALHQSTSRDRRHDKKQAQASTVTE